MARLEESLVEHPHGQRYRVAMRPTDEATEGVAPRAERQTGMMVLMERAQTFVAHDAQTETLGDPLDRKVAELLYFVSLHQRTRFR
jgi:hypothetical protein